MRVLGVDFGRRRIGLAVSDASALLARPWHAVVAGATPDESAARVVAAMAAERHASIDPDDDAVAFGRVVVGLPRRLNGEATTETEGAALFARALGALTGLPVHLQDERLTSREAESRLARDEPDWRRRKAHIDAMAASIILQDFLDAQPRGGQPAS